MVEHDFDECCVTHVLGGAVGKLGGVDRWS